MIFILFFGGTEKTNTAKKPNNTPPAPIGREKFYFPAFCFGTK